MCTHCKWSYRYGCNIPKNEKCPMEQDETETVVPCPKCGRDCDGNGVIDGIPVCKHCDKDVL